LLRSRRHSRGQNFYYYAYALTSAWAGLSGKLRPPSIPWATGPSLTRSSSKSAVSLEEKLEVSHLKVMAKVVEKELLGVHDGSPLANL